MIPVRIRQARDTDATAVAELVHAVYRPFAATFRPAALRWSSETVRACSSSWLTAHAGDELVGVVHHTPDPEGHTLDALAVATLQRRNGVGTQLVVAVEERALALDTHRMAVAVRDSLTANIAFFTALGYRPTRPFTPSHHLFVKEIGARE
ncbi:GNAT family N-acetyltransferase [Streptomyces shenzhenensis]|uniref:GNAT family N-acetyltransferase n=1 Tax=Streptomyces shenzhenensis TaxID=943815 RepID=UPI0033CCE6D7